VFSELIKQERIKLKIKDYIINNVEVIGKKLTKVVTEVGNVNRRQGSGYQYANGKELALRILSQANKSYIKSVSFYIGKKGIPTSPFGIRLYNVDSVTKKPTTLLINRDIITHADKGGKWYTYTFTKRIKVPENGFFIAMEWLPDSERYLEERVKGQNGVIIANGQVLKGRADRKNEWNDRVYERWFPIRVWSGRKVSNIIPGIKCELVYYE